MSQWKPTLHVSLEVSPGEYKRVAKTLDIWIMKKAFQPIDFPDEGADIFTRMICTHPVRMQEIMNDRDTIAKAISEEMTKALLDYMSARDTKMGYPKGDY